MQTRLTWWARFTLGAALAAIAVVAVYQVPAGRTRLEWRLDAASGIVRGWIYPGSHLPAPKDAGQASAATVVAWPTSTPQPSPSGEITPTPTPPPLPASAALEPPKWEKQDWNNCGPATLAMMLRMYGWGGDQFDISKLVKPDRSDKNVNVDELIYYVLNQAGWLRADYRVGGTLDMLKRFLAAGMPIMVEKGFILDPNDSGGGWAGHYLLLTGYDDAQGIFTSQDSNKGANRPITFAELDDGWRQFNRVYLMVYRPDQQATVDAILGADADMGASRQHALEAAQREIQASAADPYAWFNLGTNLLYFERYGEAASAFDSALKLGLPWRFTRYQFGPYIAYFNQGRFQDVIDLANATLHRTPESEESLLWHGWASFRLGDRTTAIADFVAALKINPGYADAKYALGYVGGQ